MAPRSLLLSHPGHLGFQGVRGSPGWRRLSLGAREDGGAPQSGTWTPGHLDTRKHPWLLGVQDVQGFLYGAAHSPGGGQQVTLSPNPQEPLAQDAQAGAPLSGREPPCYQLSNTSGSIKAYHALGPNPTVDR